MQLHCELNALMIFCTQPKFCSQLYNNAIIQIDTIHTMFVNVLFIFRITKTTIKFNNRPSIKHLSIVLMFELNNFIITSLCSPVCCLQAGLLQNFVCLLFMARQQMRQFSLEHFPELVCSDLPAHAQSLSDMSPRYGSNVQQNIPMILSLPLYSSTSKSSSKRQ